MDRGGQACGVAGEDYWRQSNRNRSTVLPTNLSVTLSPGSSGGTAAGASVFFPPARDRLPMFKLDQKKFSAIEGHCGNEQFGVASVTLTLPATKVR